MEEEILKEIETISKLLNGQLRGSINKVAREINLDLINTTMNVVLDKGYELGKTVKTQQDNLHKIKEELGINKNTDNGK